MLRMSLTLVLPGSRSYSSTPHPFFPRQLPPEELFYGRAIYTVLQHVVFPVVQVIVTYPMYRNMPMASMEIGNLNINNNGVSHPSKSSAKYLLKIVHQINQYELLLQLHTSIRNLYLQFHH
jgi:hypothetical protein